MDELSALKDYQALSYELNPLLWQGIELTGEHLDHALLLDRAIEHRRSDAPMTLFRGGTWRLGHRSSGDVITIPAFTSTTRHVEYTKQFMPSDCLPAARLTVRCPTATPHAPIGEITGLSSDEGEVLLGRDQRYMVEKVQCITELARIEALVGPNLQGVHTEVWDVTLEYLP